MIINLAALVRKLLALWQLIGPPYTIQIPWRRREISQGGSLAGHGVEPPAEHEEHLEENEEHLEEHGEPLEERGEPLVEHRELGVTMRDIVITCSPEELAVDRMVVVMYGLVEENIAHTEKISPTTWKYHQEIQLHSGTDKFILSAQPEDTPMAEVIGYVTFSKDELAAYMMMDQNTELERDFTVLDENGPSLRLRFSLGTSQQNLAQFTPEAHALYLALWFNQLGISFRKRFDRTRNLPDLESAISAQQKAVDLTPEVYDDIHVLLHNLSVYLQTHFDYTGNLTDLESAISAQKRAVNFTPDEHVDMPELLNYLKLSVMKRFDRTGDLRDLENAISIQQKTIDVTPEEHANMPGLLNDLGVLFQKRFGRTGNLADLEVATSSQQKAVRLTHEGHVDMPLWRNNLGTAFQIRFNRTGKLEDLEHAISTLQNAVKRTPEGHTVMPTLLANLGSAFRTRFDRIGNLTDLKTAISVQQKAIDLTPAGHASLPLRLTNLGHSFERSFNRTGDLIDIANAISTQQRAINLTPEGHTSLPSFLNNLGVSFRNRFSRTGYLTDLESAISTQKRAITLAPEDDTNIPVWLNNLGISLQARFNHTGDLVDLENMISTQKRAVDLTPEGHAGMPAWLNNLGSSLRTRFNHTRDLTDLQNAISTHQRAVNLTPERHAKMPLRLSNLAVSFQERFNHTGNIADSATAISTQQRAIDLSPEGHAHNSSFLIDLADFLRIRFESVHNAADIQDAISIFRRSATQITGNPFTRLQAARYWVQYSHTHDKSQLLDAFSVAIQLFPQVAGFEKTIHHRHQILIHTPKIIASATATAIGANNILLALSWLEQGRCLIWNQIGYLRTPADDLRQDNPSLADRLLCVASALEVSGSRQERHETFSEDNMAEMISLEEEVRTHVHLAKEWSDLLQEIRAIPEFQDFLQPPQASNLLRRLPLDGPIVIFNIHEDRCDALALKSGLNYPIHIPLKTFSHRRAVELCDEMCQYLTSQHVRQQHEADRATFRLHPGGGSVMHEILRELWEDIAKPIFDALDYSPHPSTHRRIWWCPTGPLAFLPIHAAGIYGKDGALTGPCVHDYVVSSYTPTVSALLNKINAAPTTNIKPTSVLIVSQSSTPGLSSLSGAKEETHALRDMIMPPSKSQLLENASATVARVKEEMKSHGWVHFACHAIQDAAKPLSSGVQLYDGRLEVMEMMKETLPRADLAFLSACQTSTGDEKLADEVVHLAAGMLAAGYRSVVATMWSIKDRYGPVIAKDFYEHIFVANSEDGQLDGANAARALHHATQNLRKELGDTEEALLTWVPYVHFGV